MRDYTEEKPNITDQEEIGARLLCLCCGEDPDDLKKVYHYGPEPDQPRWYVKYLQTARRMILAGYSLPLGVSNTKGTSNG